MAALPQKAFVECGRKSTVGETGDELHKIGQAPPAVLAQEEVFVAVDAGVRVGPRKVQETPVDGAPGPAEPLERRHVRPELGIVRISRHDRIEPPKAETRYQIPGPEMGPEIHPGGNPGPRIAHQRDHSIVFE
jgi:hypothetical protein